MTKEHIEAVAKAICDAWGYHWDGDPDAEDDVPPDDAESAYDDRPTKELFRETARKAMEAHRKIMEADGYVIVSADRPTEAVVLLSERVCERREKRLRTGL